MSNRAPWRTALLQPATLLRRLRGSSVVWSWLHNGIRLASGLLLLPLVLNLFAAPELGMYFLLLSLAAIVPLVDFGFGPTVGRFISYAMGGGRDHPGAGHWDTRQ